MSKEKAGRNRTIDTSIREGKEYLDRCISIKEKQSDLQRVLNKTIYGDTFKIQPLLPPASVDLIIVDPPYNLTKTYSTSIFAKKRSDEYEK
jgi:site-specific DNA-methyltransferase (adenine-specific)